MQQLYLVTLTLFTAPVQTSTSALPAVGLPAALAPDPLLAPPRAYDLPRKRRTGVEAAIRLDARFGGDVGDSGQDPPYAFMLVAKGTVRSAAKPSPTGWFADLQWGAQISGPSPGVEGGDTFLPWALDLTGGYAFVPSPGWLVRPSVGLSGQFEGIARADTPNLGLTLQTIVQRRWASRPRRSTAVQVRAVGRYNGSLYDPLADRRFNRTMCTLWGRAFLDCALAFSVRPGTLAAEAAVTAVRYRWTVEFWAGWLVAGQDSKTVEGIAQLPLLFDDGDWLWTGLRAAWAATEDISLGATLATAGRFKDSTDRSRVPFFASTLSRTSLVGHAGVRF